MSIGEIERKTQNEVIKFFTSPNLLSYRYLGNLKNTANKNIKKDLLCQYLHDKGYSDALVKGAVEQLQKAADDLSHGIYAANKAVYGLLKYGAKVAESPGNPKQTVYFIDAETPQNNDFAIAEEPVLLSAVLKSRLT